MFISALRIDNFRSLKDVYVADMRPVCIFHGPNNCGKSNILAAVSAILEEKYSADAPVPVGEGQVLMRKTSPFYKGRLDNFGDNFYFNNKEPIRFVLSVDFDHDELKEHKTIIEAIEPEMNKKDTSNLTVRKLKLDDGHAKTINIIGQFSYVDEQTCEITTTRVDFNGRFVLYSNVKSNIEHVPSLHNSTRFDLDARVRFFENLMGALTNSFQLLGTDRFLGSEKLQLEKGVDLLLLPDGFKQFLFGLSTHKSKHRDFKRVNQRFNQPPFSFGEISFHLDSRTKEVEIMIEKSEQRLPISRMGSGLQQILFLIANIIYNQKKMIGIEEVELNLSPQSQRDVFEMIKALVYQTPKLASQVLVTSHSPYFQDRADVKYYSVTYNEDKLRTEVNKASTAGLKKYFA